MRPVEDGEGVGEPCPHGGGGRLLCLVELGEQRVSEGECADVGVVGADDDDLRVGCSRSNPGQDRCQAGPAAAGLAVQRWCNGYAVPAGWVIPRVVLVAAAQGCANFREFAS